MTHEVRYDLIAFSSCSAGARYADPEGVCRWRGEQKAKQMEAEAARAAASRANTPRANQRSILALLSAMAMIGLSDRR